MKLIQLISYSYGKYTEKEKKLRDHVFAVDYVGIPLFTFLYVKLFGALTENREFAGPGGPFEMCEYLCTGLAVLAMYQHMRVSPCPLEENVEMFGVMSRIGKWIFLTRHVLALQAVHFSLSLLSNNVESFGWLIGITHTASVFIAALGIFVTIQYFTLVSPDKDFASECRLWKERGCCFRMIQDWIHIPAGFIAVLDLLFVKDVTILLETSVPMKEMLLYFFFFVLYYMALVHFNFSMTKQWYAFFSLVVFSRTSSTNSYPLTCLQAVRYVEKIGSFSDQVGKIHVHSIFYLFNFSRHLEIHRAISSQWIVMVNNNNNK